MEPSPLLSLKNELLLNAITRGELPTAKRLIDRHGAQVNSENGAGISSLQLAIVNQHSKLAEYLIQKGADIFKRDSRGWTALHDAALVDNIVIAKKLISKGLSPMSTTDRSELVIDVAGSPQMELLLCEEMCKVGEVELAKQYYKYLGLNQVGSSSSAHNSFSKGTRGNLCSPQTLPKNGQLLSNTKTPQYIRSANSSSVTTSSSGGRCKLPVGSAMTLRFTPNLNHKEHSVSTVASRSTKDESLSSPKPVSQYATSSNRVEQGHTCEANQIQTTEQLTVTDTSYESNQGNAREGSAIKSLYTHSGFQLEIGLSLLNCDSQVTSLDSEFDDQKVIRSPRVRVHRKAARTHSDPISQDPLKAQFQNPRPGRKVSFSTPPMTKTKLSTTDLPVKTNPNVLMEEQLSPTDFAVPQIALQQLSSIYSREGSSSDEEIEKAGMRALRKKPRKSSIVSPQRRRSSVERRKSVSFQPEVLLHQSVISGDLKAVSNMLESGIIRDVNTLSPAGLTALHQSAIDGNLDCAKALIRNKANVNCTDCEQWTPLHAAAVTGQAEFVRYLLLSGADANLKNDNGDTAYDITKNVQVRKMLLHSMNGKSPDSNDFSDAECFSEEEYSNAESDSDDEVNSTELFGTQKSNPSLKERLGLKHSTALANSQNPPVSPSPDLEAAADSVFVSSNKTTKQSPQNKESRNNTSSYSSYELDIDHDIDRSGHNDDGDGISEDQGICTMDGSSDCSHRSRILSEDEGTTRDVLDSDLVPGSMDYKFQEACLDCGVDALLKLVRHKAEINVNRVNVNSGVTALHHAVLEENFAFTQHLIKDFDANVHIQDRDGWTPLHAASAVGDLRIAQLLLDNGAKASILNSSCEFPVDVASDESVEKLLKNAMLGPGVGALFQGILTR